MAILNKQRSIVIGSILLAGISSSSAFAATATSSATVTVQNAFNITMDSPLDLGTIRATADPAGTLIASMVLPADGSSPTTSTTGAAAAMSVLTAGSPATYTIDSAATFTNLTITFPGTLTLTTSTPPPGTPIFTLDTFTAQITSGPNAGTAYTPSNLQTDASGGVQFAVGASLHTDTAVTTASYLDAAYTVSFPLIVDY